MAIMRWNRMPGPWFGLSRLSNEMDRFFGDDGDFFGFSRRSLPAVNIYEEPESWVFTFEIPGVSPEDMDLAVKDSVLTLKCKKTTYTSSEEGRVHRREFCQSECEFSRSIALPDNVDVENVDASLDNGVLTVTLKKVDQAEEKQIPIQQIDNDKRS